MGEGKKKRVNKKIQLNAVKVRRESVKRDNNNNI